MKKLFKGCVMVFVVLFALGAIADAIFFGSNGEDRKEINLDNDQEVLSFIQGPWEGTEYASRASNHIHFRIMIEGNSMKIWKKMGEIAWEMGEPDEFHTFSIGYKRNNVDNIPVRDINFENPSLFIRSIAGLQIKSHGIWYAGAIRPLRKGDFGNYVSQNNSNSLQESDPYSSQDNHSDDLRGQFNNSRLVELTSSDYNKVFLQSYETLESFEFFESEDVEIRKYHTVFPYLVESNKLLIISFTNSTDCYNCGQFASLQEYTKINSEWQKSKEYFKYDELGHYDQPPDDIEVYQTNNDYLLVFKDSHSGVGQSSEVLNVFYPIEGKMESIGYINIHWSMESEKTNWNADYSFTLVEGKTPILELKKKGIENGKDILTVEKYIIEGDKYVLQENI